MLTSYRFFTVLAFLLSLGFVQLLINLCKFLNKKTPEKARNLFYGNTPRIGGIGFVFSILICLPVCFILDGELSGKTVEPIITSAVVIFVYAFVSTMFELPEVIKIFVQLGAAVYVVFNGYSITNFLGFQFPSWVSVVITLLWILIVTNSYEMIDTMDGLCGMVSVVGFITTGIIINGDFNEGTAICFMMAAALCGFLVFNWPCPNGRIFMGHAGSQFSGFLMAVIPLFNKPEAQVKYYKFLIIIVLSSFVIIDFIMTLSRRIHDHRPIFSADRLHINNKLQNLGFSKVSTLYIIFVIQFLVSMIVILSAFLEGVLSAVLLFIALLFMIGFFGVIHLTNQAVLAKITKDNEQRNKGEVPRL